MKDRRDRCKCGRIIAWDSDEKETECKHCGIKYSVECDSVLVYWLEEIIKSDRPYKTEAKY